MTNALSAKPTIDTSEFKSRIREMNTELRVLESGFRASAAGLGEWSKTASGLEQRIGSLSRQMEVQTQKVAATREEWERVKQEKGENSRAAQELEIKLNKETETLGKMTNELQNTERALQEMGDETDSAGDEVDEFGDEADEARGKTGGFRSVVEDLGNSMKGVVTFAVGLTKAIVAFTAAIAAAVVAVVAFTVGPASDLEETTSKVGVVFGGSAGKVLEFGETSAQAFGLSGNAALSAAGTYGNLLRAFGLSEEASADMSISLVQLAADLASFNNMDPTEVLEKLRAGLTGETEPLKVLGIAMNQARIETKALELGLVKEGEALTAAAKAQAAYAIMMEDTTLAQGDFARTSEGLANQQRIMAAQFEDLRATIGTAFLPIVTMATSALNDLFSSEGFKTFIDNMVDGLGRLAGTLEPLFARVGDSFVQLLGGDLEGALATLFGDEAAEGIVEFIGQVNDFLTRLTDFVTVHAEEIKAALVGIGVALGALGVVSLIAGIVAAINPVTLAIGAIVAVVGFLSAAWQGNWFGIRDTVTQVWDGYIQPALATLIQWLETNVPKALETLSGFWTGTLLPAIQTVWAFLSANVFPLFQAIGQFFSAVFGKYMEVFAGLWQNVLLPALRTVGEFLSANVLPVFDRMAEVLLERLQPVLQWLGTFLKNTLVTSFNGIVGALQNVIDWILKMADAIANLSLPDWLTPGSPTPWEIGLVGISKAMEDVNRQIPVMARNLVLQPSGASGIGVANSSSVQNEQIGPFFAPIIIQGNTTAESLGEALKARRF